MATIVPDAVAAMCVVNVAHTNSDHMIIGVIARMALVARAVIVVIGTRVGVVRIAAPRVTSVVVTGIVIGVSVRKVGIVARMVSLAFMLAQVFAVVTSNRIRGSQSREAKGGTE